MIVVERIKWKDWVKRNSDKDLSGRILIVQSDRDIYLLEYDKNGKAYHFQRSPSYMTIKHCDILVDFGVLKSDKELDDAELYYILNYNQAYKKQPEWAFQNSVNGYIANDGLFYSCQYGEHSYLAVKLLAKYYNLLSHNLDLEKGDKWYMNSAEEYLAQHGFIEIRESRFNCETEPTKEALNTLKEIVKSAESRIYVIKGGLVLANDILEKYL